MELKLLCYFKPDTIDHHPAAAGRRKLGVELESKVREVSEEKAPMLCLSTLGIGTHVRKDHKGQAVVKSLRTFVIISSFKGEARRGRSGTPGSGQAPELLRRGREAKPQRKWGQWPM